MSERDGGPAFPSAYQLAEHQCLTLRDYFAAKALQGMLSAVEEFDSNGTNCILGTAAAKWAYGYADAMLKERAK